MKKRIVVLVSGNGSNLQALIDAQQHCHCQIVGVLSNNDNAYALDRAAKANIDTFTLSHKKFTNRVDFDMAMSRQIEQWQPDYILLAGFMRILSPEFVKQFAHQLINIHPSLLPLYKGLNTHQRVLDTGDLWHGCSIHFVNHELDGGAVIAQALITTNNSEDKDQLALRVHQQEHWLYPEVLSWLCRDRLYLKHGTAYLDGKPLLSPVRFYL